MNQLECKDNEKRIKAGRQVSQRIPKDNFYHRLKDLGDKKRKQAKKTDDSEANPAQVTEKCGRGTHYNKT